MTSAIVPLSVRQRIAVLFRFVTTQVAIQIIGLVSGVLLVRVLSQRQYAFYTIANTMQGTMNILADCGISVGLTAIGGKIWQDRYRFGQLINTAMKLRLSLGLLSVGTVAPILVWMLIRQGASTVYAVLITIAVLSALSSQLTTAVLDVIPRLHSQIERLQKVGLVSAVVRAVLLGAAFFVRINAAVAVFIGSISLAIMNVYLRRWAPENIDPDAPPNDDDRREMVRIVKAQAPNSVFFSLQGQISIWLIGIFGNTQRVAEVGALGRLAVMLSVVTAVLTNVVAPGFARTQSAPLLLRRYWQVLGVFAVGAMLLTLLTLLLPGQMLWILGRQYAGLQRELLWMVAGSLLQALVGVIWTMNASKAWIKHLWLYVPVTLVTQVLLLLILDVRSTRGVIMFGAFSVVPNIFLNFYMSYQGFKGLKPASSEF